MQAFLGVIEKDLAPTARRLLAIILLLKRIFWILKLHFTQRTSCRRRPFHNRQLIELKRIFGLQLEFVLLC